jgi:hypothetical protein
LDEIKRIYPEFQMSGEIQKERVFGNFKPPKGYGREKVSNSKNYKDRPGMSAAHLDDIRSINCCVCFAPPRNEAHHLKEGTGERGMGIRSTDKHAVPLCRPHHQEVEAAGSKNEKRWFTDREIDALHLADALWRATGNVDQMQRIIEAHRP